jgi:hypothetical protein
VAHDGNRPTAARSYPNPPADLAATELGLIPRPDLFFAVVIHPPVNKNHGDGMDHRVEIVGGEVAALAV